MKSVRFSHIRGAMATLAVMAIAGCTGTPMIDTSLEAEPTHDGLYPVKNSRMDVAWARPDFDITPYSKIKLASVGIEYRPGGEEGTTYYATSNADHFALTDEQKAGFEEAIREGFLRQLKMGENYELVDEAGPDVLLVIGGLLDVVSYVPPDLQSVGRSDVYLSRVGEATLVLEIRDSVSNTVVARAIDKRAAENAAQSLTVSNRVTNSAEVRRMADHWGRILREGLDSMLAATEAGTE